MRFAPALVTLAVVVPLAACSPTAAPAEPAVPATPPLSRGWAVPVLFGTEEEALAAATERYRAFVAAGEVILAESGTGIDRLKTHVTEEWFDRQSTAYVEFAARGERTVGSSHLIDVRVQRWSKASVVIYACQDQSEVVLLDSSDLDITPTDRPDIATFEVEFVAAGSRLLLDRSTLWSYGESCF